MKLEIRYDSDGRVFFTVHNTDVDGTPYTNKYRTNRRREGLWAVGECGDCQILGHCQFYASGKRSADRGRFLRAMTY